MKLFCRIFGHKMYKVVEYDNGYSKLGTHKCSRCGVEHEYQFDYSLR